MDWPSVTAFLFGASIFVGCTIGLFIQSQKLARREEAVEERWCQAQAAMALLGIERVDVSQHSQCVPLALGDTVHLKLPDGRTIDVKSTHITTLEFSRIH